MIGTYWLDANNRRKILEKFAASESFDPLIAKNWYNSMPLIRAYKVFFKYFFNVI